MSEGCIRSVVSVAWRQLVAGNRRQLGTQGDASALVREASKLLKSNIGSGWMSGEVSGRILRFAVKIQLH